MHAHRIKNLFSAIARHYDLLNALLSLKRDGAWRRETVKASGVDLGSKVLDVCTGTGELALAYADKIGPEGFVIASDFCFEMLAIGDAKMERQKRGRDTCFLAADTLVLPFQMIRLTLFLLVSVSGTSRIWRWGSARWCALRHRGDGLLFWSLHSLSIRYFGASTIFTSPRSSLSLET